MSIEKLISSLINYTEEERNNIIKAYNYAAYLHEGVFRQSGEPYIIHPLSVAYILVELGCDSYTIVAGLLHDTIEDCNITKENLAKEFGDTVAKLVDGVTKIELKYFTSKQEQNLANTRKLMAGTDLDIRVSLLKLADRLHNMRTLHHMKRQEKQLENAKETLEMYVPLAQNLGLWDMKIELENLSLMYIDSEGYKKAEEIRYKIEDKEKETIEEMLYIIKTALSDNNIPSEIKYRIKSIYGIYKKTILQNKNIHQIKDLIVLKVIVEEIKECYQALGIIHSKYLPVEHTFKDFISRPKTTGYQALHTSIYHQRPGDFGQTAEIQILTHDFYKNAKKGIIAIGNEQTTTVPFQFLSSLSYIERTSTTNEEFFKSLKQRILSDKIYIFLENGQTVELPINSTLEDLFHIIGVNDIKEIESIIVNGQEVALNYTLKNQARVIIRKRALRQV